MKDRLKIPIIFACLAVAAILIAFGMKHRHGNGAEDISPESLSLMEVYPERPRETDPEDLTGVNTDGDSVAERRYRLFGQMIQISEDARYREGEAFSDSSAFISAVLSSAGIDASSVTPVQVSNNEALPGDLVLFPNLTGVFIGCNEMAYLSEGTVSISFINERGDDFRFERVCEIDTSDEEFYQNTVSAIGYLELHIEMTDEQLEMIEGRSSELEALLANRLSSYTFNRSSEAVIVQMDNETWQDSCRIQVATSSGTIYLTYSYSTHLFRFVT